MLVLDRDTEDPKWIISWPRLPTSARPSSTPRAAVDGHQGDGAAGHLPLSAAWPPASPDTCGPGAICSPPGWQAAAVATVAILRGRRVAVSADKPLRIGGLPAW